MNLNKIFKSGILRFNFVEANFSFFLHIHNVFHSQREIAPTRGADSAQYEQKYVFHLSFNRCGQLHRENVAPHHSTIARRRAINCGEPRTHAANNYIRVRNHNCRQSLRIDRFTVSHDPKYSIHASSSSLFRIPDLTLPFFGSAVSARTPTIISHGLPTACDTCHEHAAFNQPLRLIQLPIAYQHYY